MAGKKANLEEYVRPYGIHGRMQRLEHILHNLNQSNFSSFLFNCSTSCISSSSASLTSVSSNVCVQYSRKEVLSMICKTAKILCCADKYCQYFKDLSNLQKDGGNEITIFDEFFAKNAKYETFIRQQNFEANFKQAKASQMMHLSRQHLFELLECYNAQGNYEVALKTLKVNRDIFNSEEDLIKFYDEAIRLSALSGRYEEMNFFAQKMLNLYGHKYPHINNYTAAIMGIFYMRILKFKEATLAFNKIKNISSLSESSLSFSSNENDKFIDIYTPADIAAYSALCTLASFNKREFMNKIDDNSPFRESLDLVPEIREAVLQFFYCNYGNACQLIINISPMLYVDIHIGGVLKRLLHKIYRHAFVQHLYAFKTLSIPNMAHCFQISPEELEEELINLIGEGQIDARIDTIDKILLKCERNTRLDTFEEAFKLENELADSCEMLLLRMNLIKNDLIVKCPKGKSTNQI